MKLTNAQKKRLAELLRKSTLDLTAEEAKELTSLSELATKAGIKLDAEFCKEADALADEGDTALTEDQVKSLVGDTMAAVLKEKGIDGDAIAKAVLDANKGHLTEAGVKSAIEDALAKAQPSKVDLEAVAGAVKTALAEAQKPGLEADTLAKAIASAFEQIGSKQRTSSRNVFPLDQSEGDTDLIEHRGGNLTVAQKQLLNICVGKSIGDGIDAKLLDRAVRGGTKSLDRFMQTGNLKALTTGGSGTGAELIPSDLSSDLQMRLYLESSLAAAMASQEVNMPTDPYKLPLKTTRTAFYTGSEAPGSNPTDSEPGTGTITLDAKKLIGVADYSYEADEDSIVPVLPMLQNDMAEGAAASFEGALINGDDSATHQDSDIHAVTGHHAKLFKGLRKYALAGSCSSSWSSGNVSAANILAALKSMKKFGIRRSDVALIVGPQGYNDIVGLSETLTAEKVGNAAQARILTGAAAVIFGVPIIVSEEVKENVNASGVYDGTTVDKGTMVFVHKPSWFIGTRRGFTVETDEDRKKQIRSVIASFRRAFMPKETPSTTLPLVWVGRNYTA